jgi:hypothetical protein
LTGIEKSQLMINAAETIYISSPNRTSIINNNSTTSKDVVKLNTSFYRTSRDAVESGAVSNGVNDIAIAAYVMSGIWSDNMIVSIDNEL